VHYKVLHNSINGVLLLQLLLLSNVKKKESKLEKVRNTERGFRCIEPRSPSQDASGHCHLSIQGKNCQQ